MQVVMKFYAARYRSDEELEADTRPLTVLRFDSLARRDMYVHLHPCRPLRAILACHYMVQRLNRARRGVFNIPTPAAWLFTDIP